MAKEKKKTTLYDFAKKQASKGFNYPTIKMCSDGDICTYLKSIQFMSKESELRKLAELIKKGQAGIDRSGKIVDLEKYPEAIKIKPHKCSSIYS